MDRLELIQRMNLGNAVAEFDPHLRDYYVSTPAMSEVVSDRWDIIRGTKGSGKSAILRIMVESQGQFPELADVALVPATSHQGDHVFRAAFTKIELPVEERELIDAWKVYLINVIWPVLQDRTIDDHGLHGYLVENKLIEVRPNLFEKIGFALSRVLNPKQLKTSYKNLQGEEYALEATLAEGVASDTTGVDFNHIFSSFDELLKEAGFRLWVLMDRLDDAFPGNEEMETLALKSLLYAYKDIAGLSNLKLKAFIRDDIYDRVTTSGFRSLTHVNAMAMLPIRWTEDKLLQMVSERILFNECFKEHLRSMGYQPEEFSDHDARELLLLFVFRKQVDIGEKSPSTFRWILNHVRDGRSVMTPRDVLSFIDKARIHQADEWARNGISADVDYLIGPASLKDAWFSVSLDKIETQLYAEYPGLKPVIERFSNGKAEHNETSLQETLGDEWRTTVEQLEQIGFIEKLGATWKIPFLYREGLRITQGKAFDASSPGDEEQD